MLRYLLFNLLRRNRSIGRSWSSSGDALPSVREVAGFHAINPMTVSRAYSLGEAEGLLERLRGRGMVVANVGRASLSESNRLALLERQMEALARHVRELELPAALVLERLTRLMES